MPNYNDAQGVADLLSQFDFNIINEGPGDFSTQHRKYTCEFSKPGIESFTTTYQSNPDVHGQPTATDVFAALASDALAVDGLFVDTFADELGFEKPSQAIRAYESCHKTLDWLKNDMQLTTSEISDIAETLDNELDEVKEEVAPSGGVLRRVAGPRKVPRGPVRLPLLHVHPARHGFHRR